MVRIEIEGDGLTAIDPIEVATFINATRDSGGIPISVNLMATTEWSQYGLALFFTAISCLFLLVFAWDGFVKPFVGSIYSKYIFYKISRITGRNILLVKHTEQGLFSQAMIDLNTVNNIENAFKKFNGKPFDVILHTPGGYVFYAQLVSKALQQYPSEIRALVPLYAMSGGTMLALSCDKIYMGDFACLGPVDPQIGGLFSSGSARSFKEVIRKKGRKASDSTIQNAYIGDQYTKTIRSDTKNTLSNHMIDQDKLESALDIFTDGQIEHAYQLDKTRLTEMGISVSPIDKKLQDLLSKLVCNNSIEGVLWY